MSDDRDDQAPPSKAELERLKQDRELDKHRAPKPQLTPPGPGGAHQHQADKRKELEDRDHIKRREKRIKYIEERLSKSKGKARGRHRKR